MKFLNGAWLVKKGYDVRYAANVYTADITEDKLTLYCPLGRHIHTVGDTYNIGLLTIEVTSPRPNIITTRLINYKKDRSRCPKYELNETHPQVQIDENEKEWTFTSGRLALHIAKGELIDFLYTFDGKQIARSGWRGKSVVLDPQGQTNIVEQLELGVNEKIYGLGERFTNFVKNGQTVESWNLDGGAESEQAYKNVPFYLSNKKYGLFVNTPGRVSFEIGSEKVSRVQFSVPEQEMSYSVIGGTDLKDIINNYTDLTGKPPVVPEWSLGLWLSTSMSPYFDQNTIIKMVDDMAKHDIPLSVVHIDSHWMKEMEWCSFEWDETKFPDPEKMLSELHKRGVKACLWLNPYIAQKSSIFDEGAKNGYFIKDADGSPWQWDMWQPGMAIVDFTNPDAKKWYQSKLRHLLEQGIDCFKTDFGERIPTENVSYYDGSDPKLMHNYYTLLYNQAVYEVTAEVKGEENAVVFARSATVGSQKYPVHWGGDPNPTYLAMADSLRGGLSLGMGGFGYWSHDIAGFEESPVPPTPDLYMRWTQFGLLSSHSRYHGAGDIKVPWRYGSEAVEVTREFSKLKDSLRPYLMKMSQEAHRFGTPVMRAMVLEFPDDPNCEDIDTQYMLGDDLLVAPVFSEDGVVRFYVPDAKGEMQGKPWVNLLTKESYEPNRWYTQQYDYHTLPLLVRPGADPLNV
ncbi:alpha-xylosidase [Bifidobacterium sp. ESL0690]|uniref:alpha-xylosidase n=1 Tax=Bifidobacterium sp. ESL0690 TaxID=2983214 RepID=UPI0023F738E8|nr:alpha-xylosidase [Bifidobacterium sp. ESL0690]WEV46630.1 alpha-xylosidase [Bifidobacterium sp. ESL0690]